MRCHICDKALTEAEIQITPDKYGFEPCAVCLEVAMDAAYSDGYTRPDDTEGVPVLEPEDGGTTFEVEQLSFGFPSEGYAE